MLPLLLFSASLVTDVRELIARRDFAGAERITRSYQARAGKNSDFAAALSWVARGELQAGNLDRADALASEARKAAVDLQATHAWDASIAAALGASIEVHAQVLAERGSRAEAVTFLREQVALFRGTPIHERIQKNINLLSMEGKPAPPLAAGEWLGPQPPPSLASLRGHPVLLFFWAHWCSDCKGMIPAIASIKRRFASSGLRIVAPTEYYGYVARGEEAPPAMEKPYIEQVRQTFYTPLLDVTVPLNNRNFQAYGASTTPTLVLIDSAGVVRMYHPGVLGEAELAARIQQLLKK